MGGRDACAGGELGFGTVAKRVSKHTRVFRKQ